MRRLSLIALVVLAADLVTKRLVNSGLPPLGNSVHVIGDLIRLTHVRNTGSAFSLFEGGRYFFIGFSVASVILILALARSPRYRTPVYSLSLGLILGGALGNLVDRVAYGSVTDWIDVGIGYHRWPTFNVADMGVTIGVLLLALLLLRKPTDEPSPSAGPP